MKTKVIISIVFLALLISGCATVKSPALNSVNIDNVNFSEIDNMKMGQACANYIFGFLGPFGKSKLTDAIKNGGISTVQVVEYENSWNPFVSKDCICVYGQ